MMTRRDLLTSGVALSASSLLAQSKLLRDDVLRGKELFDPEDVAGTAMVPSERLLFDFGWKFIFGNGTDPSKDLGFGAGQGDFAKTGDFKFAKAGFDDSKWRSLDLPHDWAVEIPFERDDIGSDDSQLRSHGYKPVGRRYPETSVGWYRREFGVPQSHQGRRICVEFDGAFRDALVFVNGCFVGRNNNGYAPFCFDGAAFLVHGGKN